MMWLGGEDRRQGWGRRSISEELAREVDHEIHKILRDQRDRAKSLLLKYRSEFDRMVQQLLNQKTLGLSEMKEIFDGKTFKFESDG